MPGPEQKIDIKETEKPVPSKKVETPLVKKLDERKQSVLSTKKKLAESEKTSSQDKKDVSVDHADDAGVFPPDSAKKWEWKTPDVPESTDKPTDAKEKLRIEVWKAIGEEVQGKVDAVKETGNLELLSPEEKEKIHTEIVRQSISVSDIAPGTLEAILERVIKVLPRGEEEFKTLTKEKQEELLLQDPEITKMSWDLVRAYDEAMKNPANIENGRLKEEVLKSLQKDISGIGPRLMGALNLDTLKPDELMKKLNQESGSEIISRMLLEKWFEELTSTVGAENLQWSHIPKEMRLQLVTNPLFQYDEELLQKNPALQKKVVEAIQTIQKKPTETPEEYGKRVESDYWINKENITTTLNQIWGWWKVIDRSKLSPFMRLLADIFATIGSVFPGETWDMCRAYLAQSESQNTGENWTDGNGRHGGRSGEWLSDSTGEAGEVTGDLATLGFKGNIMDSIWRWEYQPGHKAEVVPAGKSWFTLCGGIDLAYTPFSDVKNIFAGVLNPETIQQLQPFCDNGNTGPTRGLAENLLRAEPGLLQEINNQLTEENMWVAFTRSLSVDWKRLVNKYGDKVTKAPWYIQIIMLSRFYHDGSGGSSDIISSIIAANFDHGTTVGLLQSRRYRRSETYYRNRIDKEIAYMGKRPPDAVIKPESSPQLAAWENAGNPSVNWFKENAGKQYWSGEDQYDCMTSTHAALWLSQGELDAPLFQQSNIMRYGKETDLWNVSTAAARYSGILSALSSPKKKIIKDDSGYYGGKEVANNPSNIEYYIEENVAKRVVDKWPIIDVDWSGSLIHYSKKSLGPEWIYKDIIENNRLTDGQVAMMWATGEGTNKGGHEWLLSREWDRLLVYESTNYANKWVSGVWVDLSQYLHHSRRNKYADEAIIFAKNWEQNTPVLAQNGIKKNSEVNQSQGIYVGDSITTSMRGGETDRIAKSSPWYNRYYRIGAGSWEILGYVRNAIAAKPPFISILAGTNDITNNGNPLWNIETMVRECRTAGIPVFLGTLPPITGKENMVNQINSWIRNLAGLGVHIVDYARLPIQTTDGIHPDTDGYNKMKNLATSQIETTLSAVS
jgi:GDSL-like Lipase/Acylhydrolase family